MDQLVPAAQYLRVSTESQIYSMHNQSIALQEWAILHGFEIVRTYADPGRSGLVLRDRVLATLLSDVTSGKANYKAVLVYDVSRWGRFQDLDEAAHYEYLCKQAGVPVYYCAEAFSPEMTMPNLILKALKRSMAAEFSRDLAERTFYRQRKAAECGFWVGATPGYGFRRVLLGANGIVKRQLRFGERKAVQSDRIKIVLGPKNEIKCVRDIYEMVVNTKGRIRMTEIAKRLNGRERKCFGKQWDAQRVKAILTNPKYCGRFSWGKTARRLHGRPKRTNSSDWITSGNTIPAIVSPQTFDKVQKLRSDGRTILSRNGILRRCASILKHKGRLSQPMLRSVLGVPCMASIYKYFGDIWTLYRELNYQPKDCRVQRECERQYTLKVRNDTLNKIASLCPLHIDVIEPAPLLRRLLRLDGVLQISVLICRSYMKDGWIARMPRRERDLMALFCLMNSENTEPVAFYLFRKFPLDRPYVRFHKSSAWLRKCKEIPDLRELYWTAWELQGDNVLAAAKKADKHYAKFWIPEVVSPTG